ncbi:hypothetical protein K2173_003440 [Erythroxylum novogranatense]|uniref:Uncharacterized protein n=1 Tax=Erythroxylum novogranatense TaxID=1862640 RepID=A0AAV8S8R2_9ROSI|nr:hypothetical protein K2173_003440 [Erythroxylum novogranatense]
MGSWGPFSPTKTSYRAEEYRSKSVEGGCGFCRHFIPFLPVSFCPKFMRYVQFESTSYLLVIEVRVITFYTSAVVVNSFDDVELYRIFLPSSHEAEEKT